MTSVAANEVAISSESPGPSQLAPLGPPTITATPASATLIASHVWRDRLAEQRPSAAAMTGASACTKRMFATGAWFSATK